MFNPRRLPQTSLPILLPALLAVTALMVVGCGDDDDPVTTDTKVPTIVSINPPAGATDVPLNQAVTAVFSEKLAPATVNATTFTVAPAGGAVTISADSTTATFTPVVLLPSTAYTVTLTTGITDKAGNALAQNSVTTFTTAAAGGGGTPGVYTTGSYSFSYLKTLPPVPPEAGSFSVTGVVAIDPGGGFPSGVDEVCGGANITGPDTSVAFCYGSKKNPDGTANVGIVVVMKTDGSITTGSYPVGPSPLALFVYIEGLENFQIPPDFDPTKVEDWLLTVTADRTFISGPGSTIEVTTVDDTSFKGTFGGTMLSDKVVFTVSNGTFSMNQL